MARVLHRSSGMPERQTVKRAKRDLRKGRAPSTAAGEFVREEIEHIREGKHGARSTKQAIAIGLSKARRAGVPLPPQRGRNAKAERRDLEAGKHPHEPSRTRSRATEKALKREGHSAASRSSLSRQAHRSASRRSHAARSAAARKAARTKGPAQRHAAAQKAARTRARHHR
jgi:hypothetical protein